ncbi:FtsX-like permease family protein [Actinoplanes sp. NPDC051861]|uniref:FtsX-like permease family protein n=1 Tax=Actinoplanes sp. NPDC051861 TaxID=3155170 RepID=UPI0034222C9D
MRLVFTTIGVAIGVTMLLLALAAVAGVFARAERSGWKDAAYAVTLPELADPPAVSADGALFLAVTDYYDGTRMTRAYVAALGADPPVPPGLARLPAPGEVALSPALRALIAEAPELAARFPGRDTLTLGDDALTHPDELVAVVGRSPDQIQNVRSTAVVRGFGTTPSGYAYFLLLAVLMLITVALLLVPVIVMIVMVTRIAAAEREQRLVALRLAGATRGQIALVAAVETGLAAVVGAGIGACLFLIGRRVLALTVTLQGGRFFLDDLVVPWWQVLLVLAGVPLFVVATTMVSLFRVPMNVLGMRRRPRPAPQAWPALLLAVGVAGQFTSRPLAGSSLTDQLAPLWVLLQIAGFVLLGPWLCMIAGRAMARLSRRAPALIAARRVAADPYATFRAISGVVLATWVVTYMAGVVGTLAPPSESGLRPGVVRVNTGGVSASQLGPLLTVPQAVIVGTGFGPTVRCADLDRVVDVNCPFPIDSGWNEGDGSIPVTVVEIYLPTDGSLAAENRIRNEAAALVPNAIVNSDRDPVDGDGLAFFNGLRPMASLACLFVLVVGACALAAGMVGGLAERRRPFALLRASGVRMSELRRVVLLEVTAPMVITSLIGVGLGLVTSYAASRGGTGEWRWPDITVYATVAGGLLAAILFASLALPLLSSTTRHNAVRYE